jgi:hypothetical protein
MLLQLAKYAALVASSADARVGSVGRRVYAWMPWLDG